MNRFNIANINMFTFTCFVSLLMDIKMNLKTMIPVFISLQYPTGRLQ